MSLILSSHHIRGSKRRTPCRSCSKQLHTWLAPCSTRATKPRGEQACSTWRQVHVENLLLLETNIDDSSPQVLAYTMEELLLAGGLDVWSAPVYMKKGRPGTTLRILCKACDAENLVHLLFKVRRRFFAEPLVSLLSFCVEKGNKQYWRSLAERTGKLTKTHRNGPNALGLISADQSS